MPRLAYFGPLVAFIAAKAISSRAGPVSAPCRAIGPARFRPDPSPALLRRLWLSLRPVPRAWRVLRLAVQVVALPPARTLCAQCARSNPAKLRG